MTIAYNIITYYASFCLIVLLFQLLHFRLITEVVEKFLVEEIEIASINKQTVIDRINSITFIVMFINCYTPMLNLAALRDTLFFNYQARITPIIIKTLLYKTKWQRKNKERDINHEVQ